MRPRRIVLWLLVAAFVWLVASHLDEVRSIVRTLAGGQPGWVVASVLVQVWYYAIFVLLHQASFYTVGVRTRYRDLIPVVLASLFVNTLAPSIGTAGTALFADDAQRRGQPAARVAVGALFVWIADFFTLGIVLIFALIYLWARQELTAYEVIASVLLLAITAALTSVVMMGAWAPKRLYRVMRGAQRRANRLAERFHRQPLDEGWADRHSVELIQAGVAIAQHPKRLLWALAVALASHIVHILSVYTLFRAFHQQVSTGTLIAGFAIGMLFWIVAITPQGIGVVEGAMTLTYASLGVPAATAAVVSLTYRGLTFWLPMAIGFVLLQRLRSFQGEPAPVAAPNPDP